MRFAQKPKVRLFVDMDGTVAEWRNIKLEFDEAETANQEVAAEKLDELLYLPGYFSTLRPHKNIIDAIEKISCLGLAEVYILSCVNEDRGDISPVADKNSWLDKHMPFVDHSHRIFVPNGEDKSDYLPGGVKEGDTLIDDYTKNLENWEVAYAEIPHSTIKALNHVNQTKGTWIGSRISIDEDSDKIVTDISEIIGEGLSIKHNPPEKETQKIGSNEFIYAYRRVSIGNGVAVIPYGEIESKKIPEVAKRNGWKFEDFYIESKDEDQRYRIYYKDIDELKKELQDDENGLSQRLIPKQIKNQVISFAYGEERDDPFF